MGETRRTCGVKRCPKHYWFEYDETLGDCVLCEREREIELRKEQQASVVPVEPDEPEPEVSHIPVPLDDLADEPAPALLTPNPYAGAAPAEPHDWAPAPSPAPPSDWPSPPPPRFEPKPADPGPSAQEPPPPRPARSPDDILSQLETLRRNGVFTVVVIGFFAGGKTWFLNRVKHELSAKFSVDPPATPEGDEVGKTTQVQVHQVFRLMRHEKVRSFAFVDIPGELLTNLVNRDFQSTLAVIEAMKMCGALIIALPADEVLLSEDVKRGVRESGGIHELLVARTRDNEALAAKAERARQLVIEKGSLDAALALEGPHSLELERLRALGDERSEEETARLHRIDADLQAIKMLVRIQRLVIADADLTRFTHDLCFMTGLLSLAKQMERSGQPIDAAPISASAVRLHMTSPEYLPFKRPTFVAMTKADLVSDPDPLLAAIIRHSHRPRIGIDFDEDPLDTVRDMRPSLAGKLLEWFQLSKFDFVTAFHRHRDSLRIDYSFPCYGVGAVLNWIAWAQTWDGLSPRERAALDQARAIRRSRDPDSDAFAGDLGGILETPARG
jgi:hypothetical protein